MSTDTIARRLVELVRGAKFDQVSTMRRRRTRRRVPRKPQREPRLARTANADERQHAGRLQRSKPALEPCRATDERASMCMALAVCDAQRANGEGL